MELTVVLPVYNRADLLEQTLRSLQNQIFKDFTIVVCDDASTVDLPAVVHGFDDLNVDYRRFEENVGQFHNAMRGVADCESEFIKFLHADDILFPFALGKQVEALLATPDAALCLGATLSFWDEPEGFRVEDEYAVPYVPSPLKKGEWARLESMSGFLPSACMFRTREFVEIGGYNVGLTSIADWEICVALSAKYPTVSVDGPVCAYRYHSDQITNKMAFDSDENLRSRDVLWMTSDENLLRERMALPKSQQAHLIYNMAWGNLLISLRTEQKVRFLKKWLNYMVSNQLLIQFLFCFPVFVCRKISRKFDTALERKKIDSFAEIQEIISSINPSQMNGCNRKI